MIYPVVKFGQDVLRKPATPVGMITDEIKGLVADMLETMYASHGVGLAAEQVGKTVRICVIDVPRDAEKKECVELNADVPMPMILINPEILASEGKQRNEEGCLSFPEISAPITRANKVTVTYTDLDGTRQTYTVCGLLARAVQHEIDHLNGILLVDKMSSIQKLSVAGQLKRLQSAAQ